MTLLDAEAKKHTRMGLIDFFDSFCKPAGEAYGGQPDARQLQIRDYLTLILAGLESGELSVWGRDAAGLTEDIKLYIKSVNDGQRYEWLVLGAETGQEETQYRKVGANTMPHLLGLEMFDLEEAQIDPAAVLAWMRGREDRAAFLNEENAGETPAPDSYIPRHLWAGTKSSEQVCEDMRAAGFGDDAIAYALYNWCGIQNKTEIGRVLRGGDMVDASYYKYATKQLESARQWKTDPQGS